MDLLDRVMDYLEVNVDLNAKFEGPSLGDGSSIAIRLTPSPINTRFMAGFTYDVGFQILVQDTNDLRCMGVAEDVFRALEGLGKDDLVSRDNSFKLVSLKCTTCPNFVEKTSKNEYIYTALFTAEIE